jgi:hypothetical protein
MKTFAESVEIAVPPDRVWQALTRPDEVVCRDIGIVKPLPAPSRLFRRSVLVRHEIGQGRTIRTAFSA